MRINEIRKCDLKLKYSKKNNKGKKCQKVWEQRKKHNLKLLHSSVKDYDEL